MDKHRFIETYIATFLASYTVKQYNDISSTGNWNQYKHPIEDAICLAGQAWSEFENFRWNE